MKLKCLALTVFAHIVFLVNFRYLAWPENFVWPYLNSQGFSLYNSIFFIYPPLYFWLLAIWGKFFSISLISLISLNYLVIALTDLLLFFAAKRKILPVLLFIPLQIFFEGNGFWPDQLLAPLFLAAYLSLQNKKYFLVGIFLGVSLITKQTAAYFILVVFLVTNFRFWPKIIFGLLIPVVITLISLISLNSLIPFFQQTIIYIFSFHAKNQLQQLWPNLTQTLVMTAIFGPPLLLGLVKKKYLLVFLTIAASLGMFTRFSYFHLQPALPFLVLLIPPISPIPLIILIMFSRFLIINFHLSPKFLEPQVITTAQIINHYLPPGSKTLILTSNDHYYWLTKTIPVGNFFTTSTPWNLAYPNIEDRIIRSLEIEQPKFVVISDKDNKIAAYIRKKFVKILKLPDGSGIFENYPVGL